MSRSRQFDEAIAWLKKVAVDNPAYTVAHAYLARTYRGKHMYPQSMDGWKLYGQTNGGPHDVEFAAALDEGNKAGGWKEALKKGIAMRLAQRKNGDYFSRFYIAELYADLGDKDQAFYSLDTAYNEHYGLINLKTDFLLDPIRSDPHLAELVKEVGLPR